MPAPEEVLGEVACRGETHRLAATRRSLRLLDHANVETQVFDVLSDGSPCTWVQSAWSRLLERHVGSPREDRLYLGVVELLVPEPDHVGIYPEQLVRGDNRLLLGLPPRLRYVLALQFLDRTLAGGGIREPDRAARLSEAATNCWEQLVRDGLPSPAARRRLVNQVRSSEAP